MPIACGHSEDAYNYFVRLTDGSEVAVLKSILSAKPTWPELAAAAGADFYRIETSTGLTVGAASVAETPDPAVILPPEPVVEPVADVPSEPASEPVSAPVSAPVSEPAVEGQP